MTEPIKANTTTSSSTQTDQQGKPLPTNRLLKLRHLAVEGLPKQDLLGTKLPYVRGFQNQKDESQHYLNYRCQELKDEVESPRWNPDMMFHISPLYARGCFISFPFSFLFSFFLSFLFFSFFLSFFLFFRSFFLSFFLFFFFCFYYLLLFILFIYLFIIYLFLFYLFII
jgi:hypothetical protein